ncbi:hypothetical protein CRYUN_Cryun09bG0064500 [Craigia yunnanensis]
MGLSVIFRLWVASLSMIERSYFASETLNYGLWTLPAGYLEIGESAAEGAIRETWEEAGAEVEVVSPFAQLDIPRIGQDQNRLSALFELDNIPFDSLAFSSIFVTLNLYIEDVKSGKVRFHYGTINKRSEMRLIPLPHLVKIRFLCGMHIVRVSRMTFWCRGQVNHQCLYNEKFSEEASVSTEIGDSKWFIQPRKQLSFRFVPFIGGQRKENFESNYSCFMYQLICWTRVILIFDC